MDGHDLHVVVGGVDIGQRVKALERVVDAREVGDGAVGFERFEGVEVALGVFQLGLVGDAGGAGEGPPYALDAPAQASAGAVWGGGGGGGGGGGEGGGGLDLCPQLVVWV